jgi:hypothetical protein
MKRREREDDRGYCYYDDHGRDDAVGRSRHDEASPPPRFGRADAATRHDYSRDPPTRHYSQPYDDRYRHDQRYDAYDRRDRYGPPGYDRYAEPSFRYEDDARRRRSPPRHRREYESYDYDGYYDERYRPVERDRRGWDRAPEPEPEPVRHQQRSPPRSTLPVPEATKQQSDVASRDGRLSSDWECPTCSARNFARRNACYKCTTPRDENAKVLAEETKETSTLWIKNIPDDASEEQLAHKISCALENGDISFIRSIKMPREYGTDKRRGFAFVNCSTKEHAKRVKIAIDHTPFRDDWVGGVMNCEFSLSEVSHIRAQEDKKSSERNAIAQNAILQATAASAMTTSTVRNENDDYVFDEATGYFKHKVSGIFYDPNSGLFYNAMTSTWYSWSESKQEYTVVSASSASVESRDEPKESEVKKTPAASRVVHATISSAPVVHKPLRPSMKEASVDHEAAAPKYRDRANERRTLHDKQSVVASSVTGKITGGRVRTPKT